MTKLILFFLVAFFLIISSFLVSSAQTALSTLCQNSSYVDEKAILVVNAIVEDRYSEWGKGGDMIYTFITLKVSRIIRGSGNGSIIETKNMGGVADDKKYFLDDQADAGVGDQGVFYLKKYGLTSYYQLICNKYGYKPCQKLSLAEDFCKGGSIIYEEDELGCYKKANCQYSCDQKCKEMNFPSGDCDKNGTFIGSVSECNECYCKGKNYTCVIKNIECGNFSKIEYFDEKECKQYYCANETSEKYCLKNSECSYKKNVILNNICISDCFNKNAKTSIKCSSSVVEDNVCGCINNICKLVNKSSIVLSGSVKTDFSCAKNSDCNSLLCYKGEVNCVEGKCKSENCQEEQVKKVNIKDLFSAVINFFRKLFKK